MRLTNSCGLVIILLTAGPVMAQQSKTVPSAAVIAAWQKAGAEYGVTILNRMHQFEFHPVASVSPGRWPAFRFMKPPVQPLKDLPAPNVPFAVHLNREWVKAPYLKELAAFEHLEALELWASWSNGPELEALATFPHLHALSLGDGVADGAKELIKIKGLRVLNARSCRMTDADLKDLAALPNLETLVVPFSISNAGLKELAAFPKLQQLCLAGDRISDEGIAALASVKHLQALRLIGTMKGKGLKALAELKELRTLDAGGWPNGAPANIDEAGIKELAALPHLTTVYIEWARVSDASMKELAAMKNLQTLDVYGSTVTDMGLKELAAAKQLRHLGLGSNRWMTKAGLIELQSYKQLQSVNLRYATGVTDFDIAGLRNARPKLEITR